jgi:hypothetical protein
MALGFIFNLQASVVVLLVCILPEKAVLFVSKMRA